MLVEDDEDDKVIEAEEWQLEEGGLEATDQPVLGEAATLSLNSVVNISTPKTMKLRGQIENQAVVVLIDCRASHNFIAADLVEKLGIPRVGTHSFGVLMGMGL